MSDFFLKTPELAPDLEEAKKYLDRLDLSYVVDYLSYKPKITGWTKKEATICSSMYKNFLYLLKKYSSQYSNIPPSNAIDEFWHQHILFTKEYHRDCAQIFGKYLHHSPGKKTPEMDKYFNNLFRDVTQKLYLLEFSRSL